MCVIIEGKEVVHLIGEDKHVRAVIKDVRDLLHLLTSEYLASRVVGRVEDEDL